MTQRAGTLYALLAFVSWGLLPIYWKSLKEISPIAIVCHRIIWSAISLTLIAVLRRKASRLWPLLRENWRLITLNSILIGANWAIFILAVNTGHVLQASLGYYINPLLSVAMGMLVLKEKLEFSQKVAFLLASLGVTIFIVNLGVVPWLALGLAGTFGLYGLSKKIYGAAGGDSLENLTAESIVLTPIALVVLFGIQKSFVILPTDLPPILTLGLVSTGLITAVPLVWFASAAKRVPLSTIGFFQYIAPTLSFLLGVFLWNEPFTKTHAWTFGFVWMGIFVYLVGSLQRTIGLRRHTSEIPSTSV